VYSYFSGPQGSWSVHVCCLHLKIEYCSCARGRQWCGIIHYYWWTASIKTRLLFSRAGYASWGLSLSPVYYIFINCKIKSIYKFQRVLSAYLLFCDYTRTCDCKHWWKHHKYTLSGQTPTPVIETLQCSADSYGWQLISGYGDCASHNSIDTPLFFQRISGLKIVSEWIVSITLDYTNVCDVIWQFYGCLYKMMSFYTYTRIIYPWTYIN